MHKSLLSFASFILFNEILIIFGFSALKQIKWKSTSEKENNNQFSPLHRVCWCRTACTMNLPVLSLCLLRSFLWRTQCNVRTHASRTVINESLIECLRAVLVTLQLALSLEAKSESKRDKFFFHSSSRYFSPANTPTRSSFAWACLMPSQLRLIETLAEMKRINRFTIT